MVSAQGDTEATPIAPLIQEYFSQNEQFKHLSEEGNYNYLLKCVDGTFKDRFLYINTTPDGEVFGSGDTEQHEDLTMNIEDTDLDERHAEIKFLNQKEYVLSDLDSKGGTWVRVQKVLLPKFHSTFAVDLYSEDRKRVFKVQNHQFVINEEEGEHFEEVEHWLRLSGFSDYLDLAQSKQCTTLKQLTSSIKQEHIQNFENGQQFLEAINQLGVQMLQLSKPYFNERRPKLMLKFTDGPLLNEQISISGEQRLVFGSSNEYQDDPQVKFVSI